MNEIEFKEYQAALFRAKEETPEDYFHWLKKAISIANANFGDSSPEKRDELAVIMAGHLSQQYHSVRLEEALGIIHAACERIAEGH